MKHLQAKVTLFLVLFLAAAACPGTVLGVAGCPGTAYHFNVTVGTGPGCSGNSVVSVVPGTEVTWCVTLTNIDTEGALTWDEYEISPLENGETLVGGPLAPGESITPIQWTQVLNQTEAVSVNVSVVLPVLDPDGHPCTFEDGASALVNVQAAGSQQVPGMGWPGMALAGMLLVGASVWALRRRLG